MGMFCYQCQEASKGTGCTIKGVCGKDEVTAGIQDVLIYALKGLGWVYSVNPSANLAAEAGRVAAEALFTTITNANFDSQALENRIRNVLALRDRLAADLTGKALNPPAAALWKGTNTTDFQSVLPAASVLSEGNEDLRSLKELITYGLKGLAAYVKHAGNLGQENAEIYDFLLKTLGKLTQNLGLDELVALTLETGKFGVSGMALLDGANTGAYGHPEITKVSIGVRKNPGILISGHDLKDLEELLEQTEGTGVDVYTHSEMLPANYYPAFKKYSHLAGNYGNAWWLQDKEFESFNGPILFTTNCITPPKDSYKSRVYTTGSSGFPGCTHIPDRKDGGKKDFSQVIKHALKCPAPNELERGEIVGGFAHNTVDQVAGAVVDAVKSGAIKRFFVMAGCDGRMKSRSYYTDFAQALPKDTVILTAGCAKYRYNKLELGDIGGIPRVLDAGQCNDSYSLALAALKLKEAFGLDDINKLPLSFNIAWYEQKAVIVLLALLHLGVKKIHLGPTLPAFLSPNVVNVLVQNFGIGGISSVDEDVKMFMSA